MGNIDTVLNNERTKINLFYDEELDFLTQSLLSKLSQIYPNKIKFLIAGNSSNFSNSFDTSVLGSISSVDFFEDACFIVSSNPKIECAVLNSRLRLKLKNNNIVSASFGFHSVGSIPMNFVHLSISKFLRIVEGSLIESCFSASRSKNPLFLIGESIDFRMKGFIFVQSIKLLHISQNVFFLQTKSNSCGSKYIKNEFIKPFQENSINFFLNTQDSFYSRKYTKEKNFYFGVNGSEIAKRCDFIVPTTSKYESEEVHINLEGRPQKINPIFKSGAFAREIRSILGAVFPHVQKYSNFSQYLFRIIENSESFVKSKTLFLSRIYLKKTQNCFVKKYPSKPKVDNFYVYGAQAENSTVMQQCAVENKRFNINF